ncbi:hypothetical protein AGOR_G00155330 [Albula goreensis]|uniref:Uncharacterized protein n=1 Tax=Albula goreensis TaxID=1534307 RepID=A0A8T3CZ36_9TELE|nr:hypothetical protein AGOR_G00155330 [Albula goreensis]
MWRLLAKFGPTFGYNTKRNFPVQRLSRLREDSTLVRKIISVIFSVFNFSDSEICRKPEFLSELSPV